MGPGVKLLAPISVADLADRISVLELKLVNIENAEKRKNISAELIALKAVWTIHVEQTQRPYSLSAMLDKLDVVNARIWKLEDAARIQAHRGEEFQVSTCGQTVTLGE